LLRRQATPLRGDDGRFLQDSSGAIVVPLLKPDALANLARAGQGEFSIITNNDDDISRIDRVQKNIAVAGNTSDKEATDEYWIEYGPFVVILLLLLSLLFFRRGVIW